MKQNAIGGYFELELRHGIQYHSQAIKLNSGRHCFEYILRLRGYRKVYIPYYTCEVLLEPIKKLGLDYDYYSIDESFEPSINVSNIRANECFLYTNYFGLKEVFIRSLPDNNNIIIDNSQAFFARPCPHFDTLYSPRKFFGVPDGGYLYTFDNQKLDVDLPQATSYQRCAHLLKRIDLGPELGYTDFKVNDLQLSGEELMQMSKLTHRLLSSIDYEQVKTKRSSNFNTYHEMLGKHNMLSTSLFTDAICGPLVYPFMTNKDDLRERLISKRVFVPQYWHNVLEWRCPGSLEYDFAKHIVPLPVDQRIVIEDIEVIIKEILGVCCDEDR